MHRTDYKIVQNPIQVPYTVTDYVQDKKVGGAALNFIAKEAKIIATKLA